MVDSPITASRPTISKRQPLLDVSRVVGNQPMVALEGCSTEVQPRGGEKADEALNKERARYLPLLRESRGGRGHLPSQPFQYYLRNHNV